MPKRGNKTSGTEPQQFLVGSVVSMGWQLAVIVLVPLIGGNILDKRAGTLPWFTLLGLFIAMAGMIVVVSRALKDVNSYVETISKDPKEDK
jgi:F0F1-type ATP synthase assembly protein I